MVKISHHSFGQTFIFAAAALAALALAVMAALPAAAQQNELRLRMTRDFGYASGGDIQGTFSMIASGPDDLARVAFYIDDTPMGEVTQPPFRLRFDTSQYSLGVHRLYALGYTQTGQELRSNVITANFVSSEEAWKTVQRILIPLLGITVLILALTFALTFLAGGKLKNLPPGTPRKYGWAGGAICPRCSRPFPRHTFSANMITGKLERCPFCGKWSVVQNVPLDELRRAEDAELAPATPAMPGDPEADLHKAIDDSRYTDI